MPRTEDAPSWEWGLALVGYGRGGEVWPVAGRRVSSPSGTASTTAAASSTEWYVNSPRGLEQGFVLPAPPEEIAGRRNAASSATAPPGRGRARRRRSRPPRSRAARAISIPVFSADGQAIDFRTGAGVLVVHYAELEVTDASGPRASRLDGRVLADTGPRDPDRGGRARRGLPDHRRPAGDEPGLDGGERPGGRRLRRRRWRRRGTSTATATPTSSSGRPTTTTAQTDEGRAFVYHGSAVGPRGRRRPGRPRATRPSACFGCVGGDGGRRQRRRLRRRHRRGALATTTARRTRGGPSSTTARPSGLAPTAGLDGRERPGRRLVRHRRSATAGDVNGDGYADVIVGAHLLRQRPDGRGAGLRLPRLGRRASAPPRPGRPRATRPAPSSAARWRRRATSTATATRDVIVGAPLLRQRPDRRGAGLRLPRLGRRACAPRPPGRPRATRRAPTSAARSATAGDVNGDGYADVIVGAPGYDNGQTDEGRAFVYHGSASGPRADARPGRPRATRPAPTSASRWRRRGTSTATATRDVIVGRLLLRQRPDRRGAGLRLPRLAPRASRPPRPGRPRATRPAPTSAARSATAGDVNGDGYADVIVGAHVLRQRPDGRGAGLRLPRLGRGPRRRRPPGRPRATRPAPTSATRWRRRATSTATATPTSSSARRYYDNGQTDEGRAFVYHGSAAGLAADAGLDGRERPGGRLLRLRGGDGGGRQRRRLLATSSSARHDYDNGQTDEGRAFVYHGSAGGPRRRRQPGRPRATRPAPTSASRWRRRGT